jgi:hypothetical protein
MTGRGSTRWKGLGRASCPLGVCVLAMWSAMWGVFAFGAIIKIRFDPPCHNCYTVWDAGTAQCLLALFALLPIAGLGVYLGSRLARAGLVLALAGNLCVFFVVESFFFLRFIFQEHPEDLTSVSIWWSALWPSLASASVLAVLCWYLYGPRTAAHFNVTRTQGNA